MRKYPLTLLEVLIGMALLAIAAVGVIWKTQEVLARKRFEAGFQKFCSRVETLHHLALAMQADWQGRLYKQKEGWVFQTRCIDQPDARPLSPLSLAECDLFVDGIRQEELLFDFFATGEVAPIDSCCFVRKESRRSWRLPDLLHREAGDGKKKLGPLHPDEIRAPSS